METLDTGMKKRFGERPRKKETKRILLIDNRTKSALSTALKREGHHVVHCDSVQEAWNFVYPQRPHLIIFSLHDSDKRALSDLHECRALGGSVPIVVATPVHISRALLKGLPHGTAAMVEDSSVREIVRKLLNHSSPRPQRINRGLFLGTRMV